MASNELQFSSRQQPLTSDEQDFDYEILDVETRIVVQQRTSEIKLLMYRTAQDTIDIGQKLIEVKERLGHGSFINWLKSEFTWSVSTATRFMQVSEQFKFVNLMNLQIGASALYLLAAPSTPSEARTEVLERATQGEVITHTLARAIINQHKKAAKLKIVQTLITDVPSKTVKNDSFTHTIPFVTQTVEAESTTIIEPSEDKLVEKKIEAPEDFQMSNRSYEINLPANSSDDSPQDQAELEMRSLFEIGKLICITNFEQQDQTWLGEVAEVKESTATDIEVVIKISLQSATDSNNT